MKELPLWSRNLDFLLTRGPKGPIKRKDFVAVIEISLPTLSDWLKGEIDMLKGHNLNKVCSYFEVDSDAFLNTDLSALKAEEPGLSTPYFQATTLKNRVIPVTGRVFGPQNHPLRDEQAETAVIGMVLYPTRGTSAYSVQIETDEYRPRYKRRELLIVDPTVLVEPGDEVLAVYANDGRALPYIFNWRKGGLIQLTDVNESSRPFTVGELELQHYHRIIGSAQADMLQS